MERTRLIAAAVAGTLMLVAWGAAGQPLPSEGAKSGSIFGGGPKTEPSRAPASPPADNAAKRSEPPALDPRQGPGSSPSPGNSLGDTVQKQNDEAKRQREMIRRQ